jgi:exportin-T
VNDPYIALIYRFLGHPGLRAAASEALTNVVSKKMGSGDKLELITFLNLTQVVNALDTEKDVEFSEQVARLVNAQGLELTRILMEVCFILCLSILIFQANPSSGLRKKAITALRDLLPFLLRFLSDEYDDTSMAIFPFLTDLLVHVTL